MKFSAMRGVKLAPAAAAVMPDAVIAERDVLPVIGNPGFTRALVEVERPAADGLEAERFVVTMQIVKRAPVHEDLALEE
jgi:hypothetical protein